MFAKIQVHAFDRLFFLCDTFLMNETPIQHSVTENTPQPTTLVKKLYAQQVRYAFAQLKVSAIAGPIYAVSQIIMLILYFAHITSNGFLILILPMILSITASLIYLIPRRNNPDYILYPFFHPSRTFIVLVILCFVFVAGLALYVQFTQGAFF